MEGQFVPDILLWIDSGLVSRGEKVALRGTDPESYITEYTLVYEDENNVRVQVHGEGGDQAALCWTVNVC